MNPCDTLNGLPIGLHDEDTEALADVLDEHALSPGMECAMPYLQDGERFMQASATAAFSSH